ncbi:conserved hypothetical protein [Theileria equi strain WA]|uniref:SF-assemblin n=1 Tax=Theileria equi strain WA TaxID=1537102 RepID=L1LF26_THEEQ|nr:conserved hypothetical protein [Theileria equi strain WA]EKX73748.1 conserved hypothetical protein [Theileria equi strain WA]|eukprot:XP_004833200.1 conserved hypothetical protein [Theileria equi strain WA]
MLSIMYDNEPKPSIASIHNKLSDFENVILNERIRQKQEEDGKFQAIHEKLSRLNEQLKSETQERLSSRQQLQQITENTANNMLNELQNRLNKRVHTVAEKLEVLITKCASLESSVSDMDQKLTKSYDIQMIENDINELSRNIYTDIAIKQDKDSSLTDKLSYLEHSIKSKVHDYMLIGTEGTKDIQNELDNFKEILENESQIFDEHVAEELENIKQALKVTSKARMESDNNIVQVTKSMIYNTFSGHRSDDVNSTEK